MPAMTSSPPIPVMKQRARGSMGASVESVALSGRAADVPSGEPFVRSPLMDEAGGLYGKLEERILARDQLGTSAVYYDLVRLGRPATEVVRETVRIHAPYTHVPYHQRIDNGFVRFVNNDHCLLSARTSLRLPGYLPKALAYLPMAQTLWYVPTGLDPWNQLLGKAPGHYTRVYNMAFSGAPAAPVAHWEDRPAATSGAALQERLDLWLTQVMRCEVEEAY